MTTVLAALLSLLSAFVLTVQPPAPAQKPTAVIRGRITLPAGRPARHALVRIIGPTGGFPRTVTTDVDGHYEFAEMAAGEYLVSAGKPGYLALQYGQRRAFERGTVVTIRTGEVIEKIDITLQPSGAISGRVSDENGDPIEGVQVQLMRMLFAAGRRQVLPVEGVGRRMTDDQGRYRLYGVSPGRYAVVALLPDRPAAIATVILPAGYSSTYFPGRARPSDAGFVTIDLSQQLDDVDIALARVSGARIFGMLVDAQGKPFRGGILIGTSQRSGGVGTEPALATANADGTFATPPLTPGEYILQVAGPGTDVNAGREGEFATRFVTVNGVDVSDVTVRTTTGSRVEGRLVFEGTTEDFRAVTLNTVPSDFDVAPLMGPSARATGRADGTFLFEGLHGPRRFHLTSAPPGWSLKTVRVNGRDVTDEPLSFGTADESLTDVEVVLTNRAASLSGHVADVQGGAVDDYTAVVFPTTTDRWYQGTRFLAFARPKPDGTFTITALPPGDYYVAAVDSMQGTVSGGASETDDPAFLESLIPRATHLTISEGQAASVALRVIVR